MARPRVVMIDELSLGLAPAVVAELLDALAALRDEGVAVIIVEQHVDLALDVADRAYFLERGRVRFDGPAADLRGRDDLLRAVFLAGVVPSEVDTGR
jgi:branched-chain amino acid transport system ATP-binding protein